jgi:hypothetical protein
VHFGIYKAGSSYIQYLCANLREQLINHGIFFPESPNDNAMLRGRISPGNAGNLKVFLENGAFEQVIALLKKWRKKAEVLDCRKVLVSAEALVHVLATKKGLNTLTQAANEAGFKNIHAFGFFRDLVDHAISTYKHRAKGGRHQDFEHWVSSVYEAPMVLNNLFEVHQDYQIQWTFRKFQLDSGFMRDAFFKNWLGFNFTEWPDKPKVNESVTLSEVLIMQEISNHYANVANYFVDQFKALAKSKKAKDEDLEQCYKATAYKVLSKFNDKLKSWNYYFPKNEQIAIIGQKPMNDKETVDNMSLQLSQSQVKQLIELINFFYTPKGYWIRLKKYIVNVAPAFITNRIVKAKTK